MDPVNVALAPDRCNDRRSAFGGLVPMGSQITQSVVGDADQCIGSLSEADAADFSAAPVNVSTVRPPCTPRNGQEQ